MTKQKNNQNPTICSSNFLLFIWAAYPSPQTSHTHTCTGTKRITSTQCSPILNWSRKGVSGKLPFLGQFLTFCCLRSYMQWIIFCRFKSREHSRRFWCYIALLPHINPQQQCCLWSSNSILEISALTILPQIWWLESPGRDILDPGLRWECVFLQGA